MANKNFNIGLTFSANTQQAKAQIKDLQTSLNQLTTVSLDKMGTNKFTQDIAKATSAVADLQGKLQAAVNTDTGRLDLSKFTRSLQTSNMTLKDYQKQFASLGSQGERAFLQVQKAVANAEIPMHKTNGMVDKLWSSLKNVATWQLSSTILNAFTSTLSDAYQYAQDLNKSLNDIRIVTGYGVEEMDKFAVEANKAAKALSTTTTEYTKASLIYFQQGLNSQEVKERTQATIKLANVTGESAETVSEWMTAIWNNFDNGSKSLEYYADVLTKLGAATASSSDEIAGGLEKFAAIADTVGLSYEYAATALATITAQTRQSEDVVGTGLRTIFSRLQSLSLGEALEDGTDLTKYSQALETVGVNIKTASGELRDMDAILNDLGTRWDQLGKAEQNALAQTVGGVRQYANLIALMDNWSVFKNNLSLAENSTGELAKQNEIYAESWEAANDRVKASVEDLYDSILEDDLFISLTNGAADFIDVIGNMVDAMGGLKGLLPGLLAIMTKMFGDKMLLSIRSMSQEYKTQAALTKEVNANARVKAASAYNKGLSFSGASNAEMAEGAGIMRDAKFGKDLSNIKKELTVQEQEQVQSMSNALSTQNQLVTKAAEHLDITIKELDAQKSKSTNAQNELQQTGLLNKQEQERLATLSQEIGRHREALQVIQQKQKRGKALTNEERQLLQTLSSQRRELTQLIAKGGEKAKIASEELRTQGQIEHTYDQQQQSYEELNQGAEKLYRANKKALNEMAKPKAGESIMALTQGVTSFAFAWSSLTSIIDVFNNKDMTPMEKFSSILMSIGFILPSLISGFKTLKTVSLATINSSAAALIKQTGVKVANTASTIANTFAKHKNAKAADAAERQIEEETDALNKNSAAQSVNTVTKKVGKNSYDETTWTKGGKQYKITTGTKSGKSKYFVDGVETQDEGVINSMNKTKSTGKIGGGGIKGALSSLGPWLAIIAGITVLITTIKLATDHYNRFDNALKASQKNLQLQQDALQGVVEETNNLKTSMSDYSEGIRNLDKLTKGTTEYKEALIESNKAALELIQKHKNLKYEMKDGAIVIDEDSLEQAYQEQLNEQYAAQNRVAIAQMSTNQAQAEKDRVQAARGINSGAYESGHAGSDALTGLGVGAGAAAIAGGIAALASGPVGLVALGVGAAAAIIGGITSSIVNEVAGVATEREQAGLKALEEASKTNADLFKDANSVKEYLKTEGFEDVANALGDDVTAIQALVESNAALERQNDLLAETVAANTAAMMGYDNEEEQAVAQGNLEELWKTGKYEEQTKKAAETLLKNGGFMGIGSDDDWAALIEQTVYKGQNVELKDLGGVGVSLYKDGTLQGEKNAISQDTLTSQAANIMFSEYMAKGEEYWKELATQGISDATIKTLKDAFSNLTSPEELRKQSEADYKAYSKELNKVDILDDKQSLRNSILTALASGETDRIDLSILSYEEKEKLLKDIQGKTDEVSNALRTAAEKWDEAIKNANIQKSEDFNISAYNSENLSQTLNDAGIDKEAFDIYKETLAETYNMTEEFAERFAEARLETTYGIISMGKALKNNLSTLKTASKSSIEYSKSLTEVQKSLTNWLDTELDRETVEELVESGTLEAAAQGDIEAIKAVEKAGSDALIKTLNVANSGVANNLQQMSNAIYSMNLQEGDSILEYMDKLSPQINQMLSDIQNGALSAKEAIKALNSMNFEVTEDFELQLKALYEGAADIESIGWDSSLIKYVGINYDESAVNKALENMEDAIERYWYITNKLEISSHRLERWSKIMEHSFGGSKIAALRNYTKELENNLSLEREYLKEAEYWLTYDTAELMRLNIGVEFDSDGGVKNYRQLEEKFKNTSQWEEIKKVIDNYENSLDTIREKQNRILEETIELENKALEEIDLAVSNSVDAADWALEQIERRLKRIENKAFSAAEAIGLLGNQITPNVDKINAAQDGIEKILKENGLDNLSLEDLNKKLANGEVSLSENEIEKLKEYYNTVEEGQDALLEIQTQMFDKLIEASEEFNEKLKEQNEILEHHNSILENYENIIGLVGKANLNISNDMLRSINATQVKIVNEQVAANKAALETRKKDLADAQASLEAARTNDSTQETIENWERTVEEIQTGVNEAEKEFMNSWTNALETAADVFKSNVELIAEEFSKAVSGIYGTLEQMRDAFDRQQEVSKRFLADYEKTYEISKLNRNITKSIDNTKNIKAQRQLAKLASEINAYAVEGREMSKNDLEYMQKKYDLMVAQIALEEAQNAKNQVRLTRDSEGNWGYVYTANESDTEKAQQNVEDKRYAMEKFMASTEYSLTTQMIQLNEDYENALNELAEKYGTDSELFKQESEKLAQRYSEDLQYIIDEYSKLTERGAIDAQEWGLQVSTTYDQTLIHSIYPTYKNFGELQNGVTAVMEDCIVSLSLAYDAYYDTVQETMSNAGTSIKTFANVVSGENGTGGYLGNVKKAVEKVQQAVKTLVEQHTNAETGFPAAKLAIDEWARTWGEALKALALEDNWKPLKDQLDSIIAKWKKIKTIGPTPSESASTYTFVDETYKDTFGNTWGKYLNETDNKEYWFKEDKTASYYNDMMADPVMSMTTSNITSEMQKGNIISASEMSNIQSRDNPAQKTQATQGGYIVTATSSGNGHTFYGLSTIDEEGNASDVVKWISEEDFNQYATATGNSVMPNNFGSGEEYETYTIDTLGVNYRTKDQVDEMTTAEREERERNGKILAYITTDTPNKDGYYNQYLVKSGEKYFVMAPGAPSVSTPDDGYTVKFKTSDLNVEEIDRNEVIKKIIDGMADGYGKNKLEYINIKNIGLSGDTETLDNTYYKPSYNVDWEYGISDTSRLQVGQFGTGLTKHGDTNLYGLHTNFTPYGVSGSGILWTDRNKFSQYLAFEKTRFENLLNNASFDTGGYTGDWGPEGKLAVLHQKEIILNAQDTENFLAAIQIVRSLSDKLERNALLANQGLGNIIASSNLSLGGDTLEQHVTITAEFPNVVDHNEIEEAFNTLVNQASQYANR